VAICASELMPTKYLKSPTPRLYIVPRNDRHRAAGSGPCASAWPPPTPSSRFRPARFHPGVDRACVVDYLAHVRVEAEDAIRQAERLHGVPHGAHAAHEVGAAAADDDEERSRAVPAEVLAQRVGHGAERLEDIGVVDLPPMMNSTFDCLSQCLNRFRATAFIFA
jgi:hypothetical protein